MKTDLKEVNSYTRQLDVTIAWEQIQDEFEKEFSRASSTYSMKGFRKGKVPSSIVRKNLGPSIEAHFAEHSINTYYRQALDELKLSPINQAKINNLEFKEGTDLSFTAEFEVEPVVNLPKYEKKIKVEAVKYIAEKEDVDDALIRYQEQHATVKTIDTGAESGHFILGDFQRLDDSGLPVVGDKMEKQYIRLGFGLIKDDAEKVLTGAKEGDEVKVCVTQKDKDETYQVTVLKVEEQILPDIDDELAKTVNEEVSTLDELKGIVKEQLQSSLDRDHRELIQNEIIKYFVTNSTVEAPESMISNYLEHIKQDLEAKKQPIEETGFEEKYRSHAEFNIKWYILKDHIIQNENLEVSDEEINEKITTFVSDNKEDGKKIKSFYRQSKNKQRLYDDILNEKLFNTLIEYAKVKVIEKSTNELRKEHKH
ncbi:MAG: trigger factor [Candidatus Marinimicrobia bacterium]|jgi:trigger factor|nr:trigger factor [Candidatus Neomarinimicrobiota bacterium]MDP6853754.1 trigger factor [Candidatus Neomarinimicrobiota bacterium]